MSRTRLPSPLRKSQGKLEEKSAPPILAQILTELPGIKLVKKGTQDDMVEFIAKRLPPPLYSPPRRGKKPK